MHYWDGSSKVVCAKLASTLRTHPMFYLIGLGLCDEKDITVRGLEVCTCIRIYNSLTMKVIKHCERVYLEAYTSVLMIDKDKLVRESTRDTSSL